MWKITAKGNQEAWQRFCESFMSEDITIERAHVKNKIVVTCKIRIDPFKPIDSTGSMPSFVNQAMTYKFKIDIQSTT
jgi:hypothetical protein